MLLYLPGKMSARSWEHIVFADNNDVMTERDYSESLIAKLDMGIQSNAFGFNPTLSIEVSNCEYQNKYHNDKSNRKRRRFFRRQ